MSQRSASKIERSKLLRRSPHLVKFITETQLMMNPDRTEPLRSSPLRTRLVFPPAPAIPTLTATVGSHSVQAHAHEDMEEPESSTTSQTDDRHTNDAEYVLYSASSSLSQQYSPIQGPSRHAQHAPSVTESRPTRHPGDDILLKCLSLYTKG